MRDECVSQDEGTTHSDGFQVPMADGSIRFIANSIDDQTLRNLMTRNDGQVVRDLP